jgi:hypothetical protein
MIEFDPNRARTAVQFLVDCGALPQYTKGLRTNVKRPRAYPYKDDAEPLNELLKIGRQDMQVFENLLALAEVKVGSRNDYQRHYVAARRARERMALRLEALIAGKALNADEKRECLYRFYQQWNKDKADYITNREAEFVAEFDQEPSWQAKNTFAAEFWAQVDTELADLLKEAEETLDKTVKRKRVVLVPPKPPKPTAMREAFSKYMSNRKG